MCTAFDNQKLHRESEYTALIDTERFVGWPTHGFTEWAYGTPHGIMGHPLELGHQTIADKIAEYIRN